MNLVANPPRKTSISDHEKAASFAQDLPVLTELKRYVQELVISSKEKEPDSPSPAFIYQGFQRLTIATVTPDHRNLRLIVQDRQALTKAQGFYFVGFFGRKKPDIKPAISENLNRLDQTLIKDLEETSPILSYSSLELPDRYNYANLVLFTHPDGLKQWKMNNYQHHKASRHISPHYYESVKIHFGSLENGLVSDFRLMHTSFYDFGWPR